MPFVSHRGFLTLETQEGLVDQLLQIKCLFTQTIRLTVRIQRDDEQVAGRSRPTILEAR